MSLETFIVEHDFDFKSLLKKAFKISSKKKFEDFGLPRSIARAIYLKYKNCKSKKVKVVVNKKDIKYENEHIYIDSLNISMRWSINVEILKINLEPLIDP
jgi:hypothetical protein